MSSAAPAPPVRAPAPPVRAPAAGGEVGRGVRAMLPVLLGYLPFAAAIGTAVASHEEPLAAWAATGLIYGGSAQLAVMSTVGPGGGTAMAIAIGLVVNTRLLVYAATLAPHWRTEPLRFRMVAAGLLIDPSWTLGLARYCQPGSAAARRRYYLAAATSLWVGWLAAVSGAALVGHRLAIPVDLRMAVPLCLLALVAPSLRSRGGLAAAGAAVLVALLGHQLPAGAGLLVAAAVGAAAGLFGDRAEASRRASRVAGS